VAELSLETPVQYVKGVGPTRAAQLAELGVATLGELLSYYPRRYDLRRQAQPIASLKGDEDTATVAGTVGECNLRRAGGKPLFELILTDESGWLFLKWFHGGYLASQIKPGMQLAATGKVGVFREYLQLVNPRFQIIHDPAATDLSQDQLLPVYPASGKLSSNQVAYIIRRVLPDALGLVREWFEPHWLQHRGLMARRSAVAAMHRPEDQDQWLAARRRLAYDECLVMQLGVAMMRMREVSRPAHALVCSQEIDRRIRARFPFQLTAAQDKVVTEIVADLARQRPMNRLLQGDVGSGKTVVALYAALLAVARGKQAAIMAPTEILASQHFRKITEYMRGSKVRVELLTGGLREPHRSRLLDELASGGVNIIVGTHALLGQDVRFGQLALVVVDEQHKFGVRQRSGIRGKGFAPHYLVMTATPIPRTMAMTVFGDLDVSTIDQLPPGRGTTTTRCITAAQLPATLKSVARRLAAGQQAYFVYPLVNASPQLELTAAEDAYRHLSQGPLKGFRLGLLHGQMPQDQKDAVMADFICGKVQAVVASTVVEVGLDVSAANVMVVMHAERFGLAQLHQLRGRVGRGGSDATCILVASPKNEPAAKRLAVLEGTTDGFAIAEEDLRIRGPGELFGTRQHGLPELKVADLIEDFELLRLARRDAFAIVEQDPSLEAPGNQQLRRELMAAYGGRLSFLGGA
jgi:ATP-dependent DNA helicase RecG